MQTYFISFHVARSFLGIVRRGIGHIFFFLSFFTETWFNQTPVIFFFCIVIRFSSSRPTNRRPYVYFQHIYLVFRIISLRRALHESVSFFVVFTLVPISHIRVMFNENHDNYVELYIINGFSCHTIFHSEQLHCRNRTTTKSLSFRNLKMTRTGKFIILFILTIHNKCGANVVSRLNYRVVFIL